MQEQSWSDFFSDIKRQRSNGMDPEAMWIRLVFAIGFIGCLIGVKKNKTKQGLVIDPAGIAIGKIVGSAVGGVVGNGVSIAMNVDLDGDGETGKEL